MRNPLIPMGAITRSMTRTQISEMLERYAEARIEEYLFYARGGCTIPYMSEEWLTLCEEIVREAERLHMGVWLYDEYDCPSGTCARTILRDYPQYCCHGIHAGEIVDNWAYTPMADLLDPNCVRIFVERTYEKLYARLKPWFGSVIRGIFSDEPSMGCLLKSTVDTHPYTPGIEKEYTQRFGDDLFADLREGKPETLANYYDLLGERFRKTYVETLRSWCEARGVLFTGHLLEESSMRNSVNTSGNLLRALKGFSLPGVDEIFNYIGIDETEWLTLGAAYAARGIHGALAELGALGPSDAPLCKDLQMLRLAALFGIDHYVLAVSGADCAGSAVKTDWLHPTNYTQPYFACFEEYGRIAKEAAALAQKTIDAEIAIVYPARNAARIISEQENPVDERLHRLLRQLTAGQYQWILIDENDETPSGAARITYETAYEDVQKLCRPKVLVTDETGNPASDVLVRRYTDGTTCILDLRNGEKERTLFIDGQRFTLYPRDLYIRGNEGKRYSVYEELPLPDFPIADRPYTKRCVFHEDALSYSFTLAKDETIRLYVRAYKTDTTVTLDGKPVAANAPCTGLVPGLRELYRQSEGYDLAPGGHTVCISAFPGKSEPYLPSVFLAGAYGVCDEFAGKLEYNFALQLPDTDASLALRAEGYELCMKLYIDNEYIRTRAAHPFIFRLPEKYRGKKVNARIEQYTSAGPLFGCRDEVLRNVPEGRILYKYFPGQYTGHGITKLQLLIEEK